MGKFLLEAGIVKELSDPGCQEPLLEHLVDVGSASWILGDELIDEPTQLIREAARQLRILASHNLHCQHVNIAAVKGRLESAHFIEEHT